MKKALFILAASSLLWQGCKENEKNFDASGAFEANEIIISAQAMGTLNSFNVQEGMQLVAGQQVGHVDSVQLLLRRKQVQASIRAIGSRTPNIGKQTAVFSEQEALIKTQLENLRKEQTRVQNLVQGNAAPEKQLDDLNARLKELNQQLQVVRSQRAAQESALSTQTSGLSGEAQPLEVQLMQLDDQLRNTRIVNPINGTVLATYANAYELATPGKPLYKIADLSNITLRAYITGAQLPNLKLNQQVTVLTDDGKGGMRQTKGTVFWISDKAEFTPKTIQTKEERANQVYAVKIRVANDGTYKIGMYGEVKF